MTDSESSPSPVIRYFLPGLVLGAVLGGTLATIVPEFTGASNINSADPGSGQLPPGMGAVPVGGTDAYESERASTEDTLAQPESGNAAEDSDDTAGESDAGTGTMPEPPADGPGG